MKRLFLAALCLALFFRLPAAQAGQGKFTLPDGVTVIGEEAFAGAQVSWVDLPLGIEEIHARAFMDCGESLNINLPQTLRLIDDSAFQNCGTVDAYYYRESYAEQWCQNKSQVVCHPQELVRSYLSPSSAFIGTDVTLTCVVEEKLIGEARYRWERSTDGQKTWEDCALEGATGRTASFTAAREDLGAWFRCTMTDDTGTYHSLPKQLGTVSGLSITSAVVSGNSVSLSWTDCGRMGCTVRMAEGSGSFQVVQDNVTENFTDLNDLKPNTSYRFQIVLNSGEGSLQSSVISLTTQNYRTGVQCRALLIGEVSFDPICNRNWGDVALMRSMLAAVTGPGENPYTVVRRRDIGYFRDVELAIQSAFAGADEDDISLFFIASHGDRSSQNMHAGEVLLAGPQGERDYITMAELAQFLSGVPGRVVVILESCGSGAAIYDSGAITSKSTSDPFCDAAIRAFAAADQTLALEDEKLFFDENGQIIDPPITPRTGELRQSKFYVLTASEYLQMSWGTESEPAHNFFTKHLTNGVGLSGAMPADTDANGAVTLQELYAYIQLHGDPELHWDDTYKQYGHQNVQVYPTNCGLELFYR